MRVAGETARTGRRFGHCVFNYSRVVYVVARVRKCLAFVSSSSSSLFSSIYRCHDRFDRSVRRSSRRFVSSNSSAVRDVRQTIVERIFYVVYSAVVHGGPERDRYERCGRSLNRQGYRNEGDDGVPRRAEPQQQQRTTTTRNSAKNSSSPNKPIFRIMRSANFRADDFRSQREPS